MNNNNTPLKILLVKTSSMGDLIHAMPAVTDIQRQYPEAELHWLVEESFQQIPYWHPFVKKVHACAIRRWRKSLFSRATRNEIKALKASLRKENFDLVIDAQGLIKSAFMVRWIDAEKHGYDKQSIKEKPASKAYTVKHKVSREWSAIDRNRTLASLALDYDLESLEMDFGLSVSKPEKLSYDSSDKYVIFLHGTNWISKIYPIELWVELAQLYAAKGYKVLLPWGSEEEHERAKTIAQKSKAEVLAKTSLGELAYLLQQASLVVGSDTGLCHLAAALDSKTVAIYGSTNSELTGLTGKHVISMQSSESCSPCMKRECPKITGDEMIPCYRQVSPQMVFEAGNAL